MEKPLKMQNKSQKATFVKRFIQYFQPMFKKIKEFEKTTHFKEENSLNV